MKQKEKRATHLQSVALLEPAIEKSITYSLAELLRGGK